MNQTDWPARRYETIARTCGRSKLTLERRVDPSVPIDLLSGAVAATTMEMAPARFLELVADPQRWQLLAALVDGDRRVGELTELTGKPQNLVSYHLGQLRTGGLVSGRRSSADGRDTYYRADLSRCAELLTAAGVALHPTLHLEQVHVDPPARWRGPTPRVLFLC